MKELTDFIGSFYGLPGYVLVFILVIIIGYVLRLFPKFPNPGIPLTCILCGGLCNLVLADPYTPPSSLRLWIAKNTIIGLIIGFFAWRFHKKILKKWECKIPFLRDLFSDDTTTFTKNGLTGTGDGKDVKDKIITPDTLPCSSDLPKPPGV